MFVVTMDRRRSRSSATDPIPHWVDELNRQLHGDLLLPFERTVGDEIQGVLSQPAAVVELIRRVAEDPNWWVGVGVGDGQLAASSRQSQGEAFLRARNAVTLAKKGSGTPVVVSADDRQAAVRAQAVLDVLWDLIADRSEKKREVVAARRAGAGASDIATQLGISRSAVYERLKRAGYRRELDMAAVAEHLLSETAS